MIGALKDRLIDAAALLCIAILLICLAVLLLVVGPWLWLAGIALIVWTE